MVELIGARNTLLVIRGAGIQDYAARGLVQTLTPIDKAGDLRRTVNGSMVNFGSPTFRLMQTRISCSDQRPPPMLWPGDEVTIECACYLSYASGASGPTASTTAVFTAATGSEFSEGGFNFYRPVIDFVFTGWDDLSFDEWPATMSWAMNFEQQVV